MVSADSCAYVEDYAAPVFKQNASCRAVYEYAKEHLPQILKSAFVHALGQPNA